MTPSSSSWWVRAMPAVFIPVWSTGFIVARYGMPHAPPLAFLCLRYAFSLLCFLAWIAWARPAWPRGRAQWGHLAVTGALMHGGYLGGVWAAVKAGMGAGTIALLVGLQPVLTAVWLSRQGASQQVSSRQWLGLVLGLLGLVFVVWHKLGAGEVTRWNLMLAVAALLSITAGTLYQKQFIKACDVRTANTIQLLAALVVTLPFVPFERESVELHPQLIGAMVWSVIGLTVGGSSLLYMLIQRGAATQVTSLLYLVPPCTALMAWALFDEPLTLTMMAGMVLIAGAIALVVRAPSSAA